MILAEMVNGAKDGMRIMIREKFLEINFPVLVPIKFAKPDIATVHQLPAYVYVYYKYDEAEDVHYYKFKEIKNKEVLMNDE